MKQVHTIKGETHTFDTPVSRAHAIRASGNVRVKLPKGMTRRVSSLKLNIRTYPKSLTIMSKDGAIERVLPKALKVPLIDTQSEIVKTILEVRMRHPRV